MRVRLSLVSMDAGHEAGNEGMPQGAEPPASHTIDLPPGGDERSHPDHAEVRPGRCPPLDFFPRQVGDILSGSLFRILARGLFPYSGRVLEFSLACGSTRR